MQLIIASILWIAVATSSASPLFSWLGADRHIIGGYNATQEELYQVSLQKDGEHFCGGAVVADRLVVTAAHCLSGKKYQSITVRAGSLKRNEGLKFDLDSKIRIMECYDSKSHDCDIAVFKVTHPFSRNVTRLLRADKEPDIDTNLIVTGWGQIGNTSSSPLSEHLLKAKVKRTKQQICAAKYQYDGIGAISDNMICAGDEERNICLGDSGGPLVDEHKKLVGIVAWGAGERAIKASCDPKYYGVFTSVASAKVKSFLNETIRDLSYP